MIKGVLILTPYFYPIIGGVESNAERLARYLVSQQVPVQVLTNVGLEHTSTSNSA